MRTESEIIVHLQDSKTNEQSVVLTIEPSTTAAEVVRILVTRARLFNPNNYELAEIFVSGGQLCKERHLDMQEHPYMVQGLWPKGGAMAPDATYRFYLVRKDCTGGFFRTISWTYCSSATLDVPLDSYLIKFLNQKKAGGNDYSDLCSLPDLNEKTLLVNLKKRFYATNCYTYVGSILISLNPFKFYPIYNPKYVTMYQNTKLGDLPPHIFAISDAAFTNMLETQSDQCIVISGESGSGKTENTHFLLHHLTSRSSHGQHNYRGQGVEQIITGAGPVLEAFGNAKTVHNNNSSRFGKFIQVDFRMNGAVHGASVEKYLLEKSRIVKQSSDERNYHVFYYLLSGASVDMKSNLFLLDVQQYHYLNQSGCCTLEGEDEKHEFERLKQSMGIVGFKSELQKRIFAVLSAILLLGNVEFSKKHSFHHDDSVQVKNIDIVSKISELLDVREESFLEALTSKKTVAGGETMVVRYRLEDAISARDAMAKCLYGAIFDWIVWQINHSLFLKQDHKDQKSTSIGVLDIFGFEDHVRNSFEQFCINYANEHLQYYFNQHIFKLEQEEYRREKIDWQNISFIDNTGCLDLFAKRPNGLFLLLDEQGNFPGATNETLLEKFHHAHRSSEYYITPLRKESSFTIMHYAGKVKYFIHEFREKNSDLIHADLVSVLKNSNTGFIRELVGFDPVAMLRWSYIRTCFKSVNAFIDAGKAFRSRGGNKLGAVRRRTSVTTSGQRRSYRDAVVQSVDIDPEFNDDIDGEITPYNKKTKSHSLSKTTQKIYKDYQTFKTYQEVKSRETSKTKTPSVNAQFQKSLHSLLETLDKSNPYFVRCIKSNNDKEESVFDDKVVLKQLQYTGMLATVKLRQSGYNYRVVLQDFISSYWVLLPQGKNSSREDIELFLNSLDNNPGHNSFQMGSNKVFLRETVKMLLDDALHHVLLRHVVHMQSWVRMSLERVRYRNMKQAALSIQSWWRGIISRRTTTPILLEHINKLRQKAELQAMHVTKVALIEKWYINQRKIREGRQILQTLRDEARLKKEKELSAPKQVDLPKIPITNLDDSELTLSPADSSISNKLNDSLSSTEELDKSSIIEHSELSTHENQVENSELSPHENQVENSELSTHENRVKNSELSGHGEDNSSLPVTLIDDELPVTDIDTLAKSMDAETLLEQSNEDKMIELGDIVIEDLSDLPQSPKVPSQTDVLSSAKEITTDLPLELPGKDESWTKINKTVEIKSTENIKMKRRASIERRAAFKSGSLTDEILSSEEDLTNPLREKLPDTNQPLAPETQFLMSPSPTNKSTFILPNESETPGVTVLPADPAPQNGTETPESSPSHTSAVMRDDSSTATRQRLSSGKTNSLFYLPESGGAQEPETENQPKTPPKPEMKITSPTREKPPISEKPVLKTNQNKEKTTPTDRLAPPVVNRSNSKTTDDLENESSSNTSNKLGARSASADLDEKQVEASFNRAHVLRQHVRKSQSADSLNWTLPNSDGKPQIRQQSPLVVRKRSHHSHESLAAENNNKPGAINQLVNSANRTLSPSTQRADYSDTKISKNINTDNQSNGHHHKRHPPEPQADSDDSDFGDDFRIVSLPMKPEQEPAILLKQKADFNGASPVSVPELPGLSGRKQKTSRRGDKAADKWIVSSTSEWKYPESLQITESDELSSLSAFIYNKYIAFRETISDNETPSVYDRVFRDALKEINTMLRTKMSLVMERKSTWTALKYTNIMELFVGYVKTAVSKELSTKDVNTFPLPIAINAFRGYLDEFQKDAPGRNLVRKKQQKQKAKNPRPKQTKQVQRVLGHKLLTTQFNIPTFCEVCNKMMFWNIRDRGLECEACKFSCHKKCLKNVTQQCPKQPAHESSPSTIFGTPLELLAGEDNSVPPVIDKLIDELDLKLLSDGLYRKSGAAQRARVLKKAIDTDWTAVNFSDYAVHVLSLTLKNFFRELPDPVLTFDLYDEFIRCVDISDPDEAITAMRATADKLPPANLNLITRLMMHLARVAQNEKYNQMSSHALAIVFAPGLLRSHRHVSAQDSFSHVDKTCRTIEMMLNATLRKLNSTIRALDTIDTEEQIEQQRLSEIRQSMRKSNPKSRRMKLPLEENDVFPEISVSSPDEPPIDVEKAKEQEKESIARIESLRAQKDKLTRQMPALNIGSSDGGDEMASTDDALSSAESLDDMDEFSEPLRKKESTL